MSVILLRFHGMQNYYLITSTRGFTKKPVSAKTQENEAGGKTTPCIKWVVVEAPTIKEQNRKNLYGNLTFDLDQTVKKRITLTI